MTHTRHLVVLLAVLLMGCTTSGSSQNSADGYYAADGSSFDEAGYQDNTYDEDTIIHEAGDFLGDGAQGLASVIESIFKKHGRPNGYIKGTEGSGAIVLGLRYGNGTLEHKIEGTRAVHWTGPSVGIDAGGNLSKTFTLVYNLYDTEDIYRRYPAVEGSFYYVGGLGVNYHQRDEVVVVPIRLGVGLRAGANVGYLKYSKKRKILPF